MLQIHSFLPQVLASQAQRAASRTANGLPQLIHSIPLHKFDRSRGFTQFHSSSRIGKSANYIGLQPGQDVPKKNSLWFGEVEDRTDAKYLPPNDPARYGGQAHRVDSRSPNDLRSEYPYGFTSINPYGTTNFNESLSGGGGSAGHTAFVSFTKIPQGTYLAAQQVVRPLLENQGKTGPYYFYHVEQLNPANSFDPTKAPGALKCFLTPESEVFTTHVPLSSIAAVEIQNTLNDDSRTRIMYPFTPRSDLATDQFEEEVSLPITWGGAYILG